MIVAVIAVGVLTWASVAWVIDAWMRRDRRPDVAERLRPFGPASVADEAQRWLECRDTTEP